MRLLAGQVAEVRGEERLGARATQDVLQLGAGPDERCSSASGSASDEGA